MTAIETDRRKYIGSSDARDILYGNWYPLWARKTGRAEELDFSDRFEVQLGKHTEPFHIDWTVRRLHEAEGWEEEPKQRQAQFRTTMKFLMPVISTIDAMIFKPGSKDDWAILETKHRHTGLSAEQHLRQDMPQIQHHLMCTGAPVVCYSIILGNAEPERIWVGRSQEWIDTYAARLRYFIEHVQFDTAPPREMQEGEEVVIPTAVSDAIPLNGLVRRDMSKSNSFKGAAVEFIENEAAAKTFEKAKKDLKNAFEPTDGELYVETTVYDPETTEYNRRVCLSGKRDKRGSIRFKVEDLQTKENAE